jgi:hypothetical protein
MRQAYLADIYQHLNTLITSMQGPKENFNLHRQTSCIQEQNTGLEKTPFKWKY